MPVRLDDEGRSKHNTSGVTPAIIGGATLESVPLSFSVAAIQHGAVRNVETTTTHVDNVVASRDGLETGIPR